MTDPLKIFLTVPAMYTEKDFKKRFKTNLVMGIIIIAIALLIKLVSIVIEYFKF